MTDILKDLPKVELHLHLDGSVRKETLYELLLDGEYIEKQDFEEFKKLISVGEDNDSLKMYLEKFELPLKVMQTEENIERIVYELLEDLDRQNVIYAEIRFAPYLHTEEGLEFDEIVQAAIRGQSRAMEDFEIRSNLILIAMRHEDAFMTVNVVNNGLTYLNEGVTAVDLAGNEADFPPEIHKSAFKMAHELGFHVTVHAGETGIVENIPKSIDLLYAERIGHGIAAIKDEEVMKKLIDEKIYLEMCPISNRDTKAVEDFKDYPIRDFIEKGILVTINTDNMTVSNTSLEKEYEFIMENFDFTIEDIIQLNRNSIEAAFVNPRERIELRRTFKEKLKKLGYE